MAALSHNRSKNEHPCISVQLSVCICGKKREKGEKGKARGGGSDSFAVGGGDVSPGIRDHRMLSPFLGARGWLRQLCCWRGRREPR